MKKKFLLRRSSEKGQGFLELGISMVFLLILLAVVIDLGWAFFTLIALRDAAQEAASVGAICPVDQTKIQNRLRAAATAPLDLSQLDVANQVQICVFDPGAGHTCITNPTSSNVLIGYSVEVKLTYNHDIMVPFIGAFIGRQSYPLTATSVDTILTTDCRITN